jgi:hypothetical protein
MADNKLDPLRGELQEAIERAQRQLVVKVIRQGDLVDDAIGLLTEREVIGRRRQPGTVRLSRSPATAYPSGTTIEPDDVYGSVHDQCGIGARAGPKRRLHAPLPHSQAAA